MSKGKAMNEINNNVPESNYYENDNIWSQDFENDPDESRRFDVIERLISQESKSILDVGCGNGDFLQRLSGKYDRICGVDRSRTALKYVSAEKQIASIDDLPFDDLEFDTVCCLEVIEHLPLQIYEKGLRELMRVARKQILISVPFNENTRAGLVTCPSCFCAFNRSYHLRSFGDSDIGSLFKNIGNFFELDSLEKVGNTTHHPGLYEIKKLLAPFRSPRLPDGAVCPQCGYTNTNPADISREGGSDPAKENAKSTLRSILPRLKRPRWVVGSFSRAK
jgi:ubiquinone/menaquinone biosynthesis C-methylase UbiE